VETEEIASKIAQTPGGKIAAREDVATTKVVGGAAAQTQGGIGLGICPTRVGETATTLVQQAGIGEDQQTQGKPPQTVRHDPTVPV
jgi:hypothetical protein